MKVCFLTLGTRGDIQPYLALAKKLITLGHKAVICTSASFQILIESEGVEFKKASLDLMSLTGTEEGRIVLEAPIKNLKLAVKMSKEIINPGYRRTFDDFFEAAQGCDVIVYHPKAFVAVDIALKINVPCVSMPPIPITYPIIEFPCIAISAKKNLGSVLNKLSYGFNEKAELGFIKEINDFRIKTLGELKRKAGQFTYFAYEKKIPIVYPISKYLFNDVNSWNNHVEVTGFFFLSTDEKLSNSLESFLQKGNKPITITFSSIPLKNPNEFINKLEYALKATNNRAVLLTGNSKIEFNGNENIFVETQAPHTLLFSRSKAVIHHGGAGTTAAALLSGIPQLIIPFSVDQPFWAQRVYQNNVSLKPLKEIEITNENLKNLMIKFDEKKLCENAKLLGKIIKSENGLQNAADFILALRK